MPEELVVVETLEVNAFYDWIDSTAFDYCPYCLVAYQLGQWEGDCPNFCKYDRDIPSWLFCEIPKEFRAVVGRLHFSHLYPRSAFQSDQDSREKPGRNGSRGIELDSDLHLELLFGEQAWFAGDDLEVSCL
jgi:hypothetical protein